MAISTQHTIDSKASANSSASGDRKLSGDGPGRGQDAAGMLGQFSPAGAPRGRMGQVLGVQLGGIGAYVPENIVTNEDLAALGCDSDWIVRRTGILQRCHALPGQSTGDLAYEASRQAIQRSKIDPAAIDLLIVATITPDHMTPSTACHLQKRLGLYCPAMDVSAACAGFVYALVTAANIIRAGNCRHALVVGADLMSRTIDPDDKKTFPLFGDGAGAVVLSASEDETIGLLSYQLGSEGDAGEMLCIPAGGTRLPLNESNIESSQRYLQMDGRNVFKWAVRLVDESIREVLADANLTTAEIQHVLLHQANQRIIDSAVSDLGFAPERVFMNLDRYGNTSAASIPLAMAERFSGGRVQPGDRTLLCGFGSGLAWGTALLQS
ncbi:MAG: beta-ketoacyl-ACP synthase III [Planctomycetota bacterium]